MTPILDFLNQAIFSIHGTPVALSEILGFVLGVATVYLVAANNIWTFPVGIVQSGFFFVLFLEAKLYADMWLQVFFIVVQFVGWAAWLKAGPNRTKLQINETPRWVWAAVGIPIIVFVYLMIPVLHHAHGAYPVWDSTSTGLSVGAQFLMTFKLIENWYLWIAADLIYIPVYFLKHLYFTSILYVVFLIICVGGLRYWRRIKDGGEAEGRDPNSAYAVDVLNDTMAAPLDNVEKA